MFVVSNQFVVGLYAYIRQAALSIDRTGPDFKQVLRQYFKQVDTPTPEIVLDALGRSFRFTRVPVFAMFDRTRNIFSKKHFERIQRSIQALANMLSDEGNWTDEEKVTLRLELSSLETCLRSKLPRGLVDHASQVEHYNQSDRLTTSSLAKIVGSAWPK